MKKYYLMAIIATSLFVYYNEWLLSKYPRLDYINKAIDEVNPFVGRYAISALELDEINLIMSSKDIAYFKSFIKGVKEEAKETYAGRPLIGYSSELDYRKIKIFYNGIKHKGKIRIHGTSAWHFMHPKKSYAIKLDKENLIRNMRRFSIINLGKPALSTIASYRISKLLGLFKVTSYLVKVKINDKDQGVYLLEEKLHKSLLEKNALSGVDIVKPIDDYNHQYPNGAHEHPFVFDLANTQIKRISKKHIGQLLKYRILYSEDALISDIKKSIDIKKFAKTDAARILFGDVHGIRGANQKLLYDTSTGRFFPYFRTEGLVGELIDNGYGSNFEKSVYENPVGSKFENNILYKKLVRDDEYRVLRNKYLHEIIEKKDEIEKVWLGVLSEGMPILRSSRGPGYSSRRLINFEKENFRKIQSNFLKIKRYLDYAKIFVEIVNTSNNKISFKISPDTNAGVLIEKISSNLSKDDEITIEHNKVVEKIKFGELKKYLNKYNFIMKLDKSLEVQKTVFEFIVSSKKTITSLDFLFQNKITKNLIRDKNVYKYISLKTKNIDLSYLNISVKKFIKENDHLLLSAVGKNIYLKNGDYEITKDLIIPYGYNLNIEQGTKITISNGKSILIYGGLFIKGIKNNPVVIRNSNNKGPFGSIGVIGDGSTNVDVNYLDISGGSEAEINAIYLSGALSLYNHNTVQVENSLIHHNYADDGLNIKTSKVELKDNKFFNNFADQVDLDYSQGVLINNDFTQNRPTKTQIASDYTDPNGDGLDLSTSNIVFHNNKVSGFLDKGISIGENTFILIYKNKFNNNRSAITAKDQSKVYIYNNSYLGNEIDVEMYRKKNIFNYPLVFSIPESNNKIKKSIGVGSRFFDCRNKNKLPDNSADIIKKFKNLINGSGCDEYKSKP
jgi:hypothetical protein